MYLYHFIIFHCLANLSSTVLPNPRLILVLHAHIRVACTTPLSLLLHGVFYRKIYGPAPQSTVSLQMTLVTH